MNEQDAKQVRASAIEFAAGVLKGSRTRKAGKLRLLAARYLATGKPSVNEIAARMNVTRQRVYQAIAEVRRYCGV